MKKTTPFNFNHSKTKKDKTIMEDSNIPLKLNPTPIHNIIKSNLVQHSNKILCSHTIDELSVQITETIEWFLNKSLRKLEVSQSGD